MSKLRVAVLGAKGRIGAEAVRAVEAAEDMELVAALGRGTRWRRWPIPAPRSRSNSPPPPR